MVEALCVGDGVGDIEDEVSAHLDSHRAEYEPALVEAGGRVAEAERERNAAEDEAGRTLTVSDRDLHLRAVILLGTCLGIEAIANAAILAIGSRHGLIGGAITAFGIAALSISLSYSAGIVLRALLDAAGALIAGVFGLACAAGIIAFHTSVAWFRTLLTQSGDSDAAARQAVDAFLQEGWAFGDLASWALLLIGVSAALWACVAGFNARDRKRLAQAAIASVLAK